MWKKHILARAIRIQKRKLGVTTHFKEIIELEFEKRFPYSLLEFIRIRIMVA